MLLVQKIKNHFKVIFIIAYAVFKYYRLYFLAACKSPRLFLFEFFRINSRFLFLKNKTVLKKKIIDEREKSGFANHELQVFFSFFKFNIFSYSIQSLLDLALYQFYINRSIKDFVCHIYPFLIEIKRNDIAYKSILEIGCGSGAYLRFLTFALKASGTGLDLHMPSIKIAKQIFKKNNLTFLNEKVNLNNLKKAQFDYDLLLASSFLVYLRPRFRRKLLLFCINNSIDIICIERFELSLANDLKILNIKYTISEKPRKIIKFYFQSNLQRNV